MRTLAFVATGSFAVLPLIHGLGTFGLELMNKKAFTYTLIAKIGCLLPGTTLYVVSRHPVNIKEDYIITYKIRKTRFPESWWPGRFDMCSSHSFMHIMVVCAAIIQMIGYLEAFDYAHANMSCLNS
jgi:adiponectin receptor